MQLSQETYTKGVTLQNVLDSVPRAVSGAAACSPQPRSLSSPHTPAPRLFRLELAQSGLPGPSLPGTPRAEAASQKLRLAGLGCSAETSLPTLGFPGGLPVYTEGRGTPCQDCYLAPCPRAAFLNPLWLLLAASAPRRRPAPASGCGCGSVQAAAAPAAEDRLPEARAGWRAWAQSVDSCPGPPRPGGEAVPVGCLPSQAKSHPPLDR